MKTNFKISAIENEFNHLFNLSEKELSALSIVKMIAKTHPVYPCRVSLKDAEVGEELLLLPFQHHKTTSPYQATGPIFIRKNVKTANLSINEIPKMLLHRQLCLRVYNETGMMIAAKTLMGETLKTEIEVLFENGKASYIQIHNAGPGCYNCQVNRVE